MVKKKKKKRLHLRKRRKKKKNQCPRYMDLIMIGLVQLQDLPAIKIPQTIQILEILRWEPLMMGHFRL